ncbi:MAG: pentapeptide repeat-containing protein [Pseudomonadota bacterium]
MVRGLEWLRKNYLWVAIPVGGVAYVLIALFITWELPGLADQRLTRLADIMEAGDAAEIRNIAYAVGALLGALAILATIPFQLIKTWMNERAARTDEAGQITDRINKAVEQLGAEKTVKDADGERTEPNLEVRLGGIYALERIAQDSLRDHIQVMEILTAYIRHNAPTKGQPTREEGEDRDSFLKRIEGPRIDIEAAIRVIGRRSVRQIEAELRRRTPYRPDLCRCCLRKANFLGSETNFACILFQDCLLERVNFSAVHSSGTIFIGSNLEFSEFLGTNLKDAIFTHVKTFKTNFSASALIDASLGGENVKGISLHRSSVVGANIWGSHIRQRHLDEAFGDINTRIPKELKRPKHWDVSGDPEVAKKAYRAWMRSHVSSNGTKDNA